jgi:hypothetical protein
VTDIEVCDGVVNYYFQLEIWTLNFSITFYAHIFSFIFTFMDAVDVKDACLARTDKVVRIFAKMNLVDISAVRKNSLRFGTVSFP